MPPEPSPWDRKKQHQQHDRSDGSIRSVARWRDSHHAYAPSAAHHHRWDDFRRPQGHGKQGGGGYQQHHQQQLFTEDSGGHGFMPSRAFDRMVVSGDDSSFRSPLSRGRYGRNTSRDIRGSFSNKGFLWESGDASTASARQQHDISAQRSVSDLQTYASHPQSVENSSSWHHLQPKAQNDKMPTVDALGTDNTCNRDQSSSLGDWKPLKWNRTSSLSSSRGSGFSHTSSSRSMGADSDETKPDLPSGRLTPALSPSGDAATACVASSAPFEDTCPRKKPRLGWGQGLAKYEKQKVEGSDETLTKNGLVPCASLAKPSQTIQSMPDKSPQVAGISECASPVTTSSVACSSSPGMDDRSHMKAGSNYIDVYNLSGSPAHWFQSRLEEFVASLEHSSGGTNLSSLLSDLLQQDDVSSGDSNIVKSSPMNKLLLVKSELSKALEKTECEIDMSETELKLLSSECILNSPRSVASDSLQVEFALGSCENVATFSKFCKKPVSSSDLHVDMPNLCNEASEQIHGEVKDDDIDSPGTATSKFVEPSSMEKAVSAYSMVNHDNCSTGFVTARPAFSEKLWFLPSANEEKSTTTSGGKGGNQQTESSVHTLSNPGPRLNDLILDSNRESARQACEVFNKLLPDNHSETDIWGSCSFSSQKSNSLVKQKLASRKCFRRFKERVLTLKYRALQHLWKEDMRLLSIRKYKVKSQKRIESNSRAPHIVYQKHRSSVRSRFTSAGSLTLVPTSEIRDFTSKLLSDSKVMLYRDNLKMPALVDEQEKRMLQFVSSNGLVEDPCATEKERAMINPWTPEEKAVFLEKLGTIGKDFRKIASYLDHKTTADCVEFYYKNHKSESFEKIKKKSELKTQGNTYLMTSGQKWNREVNTGSLVLLGEASVIAAHADDSSKCQPTYSSRSFLDGQHYHKTCWGEEASYEKSSSGDVLCNDREATAADTLAGICGALSSEAMSSCVTSSIDPSESFQEGKFHKTSATDRSATPQLMESIDDEETCSDESCGEMDSVDWTDEEKSNFIGALRSYGKDFVKVARCLRSKSKDQCKVFFSKARKKLGLDVMHLENDREGSPLSDANGGRSDTEDAGVLEIESAICSTLSYSKMDIAIDHLQTDKSDAGEKNGLEQLNHTQTDEPERSGEHNGTYLSKNHDDGVTVGEGFFLKKCQHEHEPRLVLCDEYSSVKKGREKSDGSPEILQPGNASETESSLVCGLPVILNGDVGVTHSIEGVNRPHARVLAVESIGVEGQGAVNSIPIDGIEHKAISAEGLKPESRSKQTVCLEGGQDCNGNIKTGNNRSSSTCSDLDPNASCNSTHQAAASNCQQSLSLSQSHQPQIPLELLNSVHKAQIISWKQKENSPTSANSVLPGSHVIHYEDHPQQGSSSTLNFDGTRSENCLKPVSADVYQRGLLCQHSMNPLELPQLLRGYPLQVLSKKDVNGHRDSINSEKQPIIRNSTINGNYQPAQFIGQDFHGVGSNVSHSLAGLPPLSKNHEQSSLCHRRTNSQGSSDADEHSCRVGDVKLFGKILSHPSTSRKPNLTTHETDNQVASHRKSSDKPFDLKFTDQENDRALMVSNLQAKYTGLEGFPATTYGYWDGNRIQTGLSSLPDSSTLLGKYPAAFNDYAAASSCGDQQSLPAVSKWNDRNLSSVSSSGSLADYQVYRGYDAVKVPFPVDVKRHDPFFGQQKRNGLEGPSFQKQSRGVIGMNVMGPGILVGGSCTGVSDPVAAIKMHYATTERYGMSGSHREGDSWRGDIGRQ
ncbi:Nuclear receptor corepressor [Thalictrum thalictroides]|uniref:Nuclear receptor corepressor n=1 Tax=Thalictrum thalictroides TaxID=46969 RepID=A0A7J6V5P1_THATH|nr:Nuclear receptor corepressor [Thalictrum thalictroides]